MRLTITGQLDRNAAERSIRRDVRAWIGKALDGLKRSFRELYERPGVGPSQPGEPPRKDSGELGEKIRLEQPSDLTGELLFAARHASYLQEGTVHLVPRPYLEPTINGFLADARRGGLLSGSREGGLL